MPILLFVRLLQSEYKFACHQFQKTHLLINTQATQKGFNQSIN